MYLGYVWELERLLEAFLAIFHEFWAKNRYFSRKSEGFLTWEAHPGHLGFFYGIWYFEKIWFCVSMIFCVRPVLATKHLLKKELGDLEHFWRSYTLMKRVWFRFLVIFASNPDICVFFLSKIAKIRKKHFFCQIFPKVMRDNLTVLLWF